MLRALALSVSLWPALAPAAVGPAANAKDEPAAGTATAEPPKAEPTESPAATPTKAEPGSTPTPEAGADEAPAPADAQTVGVPVLDEAAVPGPKVDDGVLPCGLRVILAQDASLPVAAVVLAIETGTEDDPASQPGLVHALAYHLLQGNRELPPGGAAALVQDRGGFTTLTVGPAQVRFESLVPISALDDVLWAESQRLRAPTVSSALWHDTLRWARRDKPLKWRVPRKAMADAHGVPGLEHEGRTVTPQLDQMLPRAVGQALADRYRYSHATLIVVSPHPPAEMREQVEGLFAELPTETRHLRDRTPRWRSGSVPQALAIASESGRRFVMPVAPDPASIEHATVFCRAINHQRRRPGEPGRARLRCNIDLDPRRPTMFLTTAGAEDPIELLSLRIDRLERNEDDAVVERQREILRQGLRQSMRSALPLARRLSAVGPRPDQEPGWMSRPTAALTGEAVLSTSFKGRTFGPRMLPGAAIHLIAPEPPK